MSCWIVGPFEANSETIFYEFYRRAATVADDEGGTGLYTILYRLRLFAWGLHFIWTSASAQWNHLSGRCTVYRAAEMAALARECKWHSLIVVCGSGIKVNKVSAEVKVQINCNIIAKIKFAVSFRIWFCTTLRVRPVKCWFVSKKSAVSRTTGTSIRFFCCARESMASCPVGSQLMKFF